MSRRHRVIHLVSFVAIMVSLFSPVLTLPVIAEDQPPKPDVTLNTDTEDSTTPTQDSEPPDPQEDQPSPDEPPDTEQLPVQNDPPTEDDPPAEPAPIAVIPATPLLTDATCGDGVTYAQTASAPVTDGIDYQLSEPDADGNFTTTATLTDATVYTWADSGLDGWSVVDNTATATGTLALCPAPEPETEEPVEQEIPTGSGDSEASTPEPADEIETPIDTAESDQTGDSTSVNNPDIENNAITSEVATPPVDTGASRMDMGTTDVQQITMSMNVGLSAQIQPGSTITYTLEVVYVGPVYVSYSIEGTLPEGTTVKSFEYPDSSADTKCTVTGQQISCNQGENNYLAGIPDVWKIVVSIDDDFANERTCANGLVASFEVPQYAIQVVNPEPSSLSLDPSDCTQNVEMTHSVWNTSPSETPATEIQPGMSYDYRYQVANNSALPVSNFSFAANLPEGVVANWDGSIFPPGCAVETESSNQITCTEPLNPGENILISISGNVPQDISELAANACIDGLTSSTTLLGSNKWSTTPNVHTFAATVPLAEGLETNVNCASPSLSMRFEADTPIITNPEDRVAFTITLSNTGSNPVTGLNVVGAIPIAFIADDWIFTDSDENANCTLKTAEFTAVVCEGMSVPAQVGDVPGTLTVHYSLAAGVTYPESACTIHQAMAIMQHASLGEEGVIAPSSVTIDCEPRLVQEVTADRTSVAPGELVEYTIHVTNTSNWDLNHTDENGQIFLLFLANANHGEFVSGYDSSIPNTGCQVESFVNEGFTGFICYFEQGAVIEGNTTETIKVSLRAPAQPSDALCASGIETQLAVTDEPGRYAPGPAVALNCGPELSITADTSATNSTVTEATPFNYTVLVKNTGGADSGEFSFTTNLPPGFVLGTNGAIVPEGASCENSMSNDITTIDCNGPSFGPDDEPYLFIFRVIADSGLYTGICDTPTSFTATGETGAWGDPNSSTTPTFTVDCIAAHLLTVEFEADKTQVEAGDVINYTAKVTNIGSEPEDRYLFIVHISDHATLLDDPAIVTSGGVTCESDSGELTCSAENMEPDDVHTLTYSVQVTPEDFGDSCGVIGALFAFHTGRWDDDSNQHADVERLCPMLSIDLTDNLADGESVGLNDPFTYTITLTNTGSSEKGGFGFLNYFPASVVLAPDAVLDSRCQSSTVDEYTVVSCSGTDIPLGQGNGLTFDVNVVAMGSLENPACGTITAKAQITRGFWVDGQNAAEESTDIECIASVDFSIEPLNSPVVPGDSIGFKIRVHNDGDEYITDIVTSNTVIPDLPADLNWSISTTYNGVVVEGIPRPLVPGDVVEITFESPAIPTDLTLPANEWCKPWTMSSDFEAGFLSSDVQTASDSGTVEVLCSGLTIEQTVSSATITPGGEVEFTITVTNVGNSTLENLSVLHAYNETGLVFSNWQASVNNADLVADCAFSGPHPGCEIEALAPNTSVVVTVTADAPLYPTAEQCEPVTSRGIASYGSARTPSVLATGVTPPETLVSSDPDTTTQLDCEASFTFSSEPIQSTVTPGETLGYELTAVNTGTLQIESLNINLDELPALPAGSWNYSATIDGVEVQLDNPTQLPALDAGKTLVLTVVSDEIPADLTLPENEWCTGWPMNFNATAGYTWSDDIATSDVASVQVNCTGLSIVQEVSSAKIALGGQVEFTITVTNQGNTTVSPMMVFHDSTETGTVFSNWQVTSEDYLDCGLVEDIDPGCTYLALDPGDSIQISVTGDAPESPTLEQCAPVESAAVFVYGEALTPMIAQVEQSPPYTQILSEPVEVQLDCQSEISVLMEGDIDTGENDRVDAGDTVTLTINVTNSGNMPLYDIIVQSSMENLEWDKDLTIAELLPGSSETFTAVYTITQEDIDAGVLESTTWVEAFLEPGDDAAAYVQVLGLARAQVAPVIGDPISSTDTLQVELGQEPGIQLEISSDVNEEPALEDIVTYTFTVTNTGNVTLTDIDILPETNGLVFANGTTIASLAPGEQAELIGTYTITQADVDAGSLVVCADSIGLDPNSEAISDTGDCSEIAIAQPDPVTPTPEPTAPVTPDPATPVPGAPDADETPAPVTSLPETGTGNVVSMASILWIAATIGILAFGIGAAGVRKGSRH